MDGVGSNSDILFKQKEDEEKIRAQVERLKSKEQQVIAHENAHKAVAGRYAGSMCYTYTRGPDGKIYITGGEVSIDVSEERTPEATIRKMQVVKAAALAPADPSPQDLNIARVATMKEMKARAEFAKELFYKNYKIQNNKALDRHL
ncbi:MAG: putative metalloprotease CJM1_0395 family protein [Pseudothermotoga sp.]